MTGREQEAGSREQLHGISRKVACVAFMASLLWLTWNTSPGCAAFSFDDIEFWIGTGANRAALVIDWKENDSDPPALAWGFCWDGAANARDMLVAIVAADPRLYAKVGGSVVSPVAVYGLGYDANDDGLFSVDDGTQFDANGFALSTPPDLGVSNDPADYYAEGWFAGFWHYGIETPDGSNPYDSGDWLDITSGLAGRELVDGSWDSWAFENSTLPPFEAYADNPVAAPSPYPPGDFNQDGKVGAVDYEKWRGSFGSTTNLAADANHNGTVDAADYVIWRGNLTSPAAATITATTQVPEPNSMIAVFVTVVCSAITWRRKPLMAANHR